MTHKTRKVRKRRQLRTKTDRKSRKKILRKSRRKSHKKIQKGGNIMGEGASSRTYGEPAIPCDSGDVQIYKTGEIIKDYEFQGLDEQSNRLVSRVPLKRSTYEKDHERLKIVVPLLMREFGEDLMNKQFMPPIQSCKIPDVQKGEVTAERGVEIGDFVNRGDDKFPEGTDWWHSDDYNRIPEDVSNQIIFESAYNIQESDPLLQECSKLLNIFEAIRDMKSRKIIHGDIHLGNIMNYDDNGRAIFKIIDLGGITKQDLETLERGGFMWDLLLPFDFDRSSHSLSLALSLLALPRSVVEGMVVKKLREQFMEFIGPDKKLNFIKTIYKILDFADRIRTRVYTPEEIEKEDCIAEIENVNRDIQNVQKDLYNTLVMNKIEIRDTNTKIIELMDKYGNDGEMKSRLEAEKKENIDENLRNMINNYMLLSPEERVNFVFGHVDCDALVSVLLDFLTYHKYEKIDKRTVKVLQLRDLLLDKPEAIDILFQIMFRLKSVFDPETQKLKTPDMDEIVQLYRDFLTKIGVETADGGAAGGGAAETG